MKRVVSLCIAVMLVVSLLPVSLSSAEDCVYLSDIAMESFTKRNDNWVPGMNQTAYYKTGIKIAGKSYSKGICMHPLDEGSGHEAECVWDISSYSFDCFTAVIGKDDAGKSGLTEYQLGVYADTKASFYVYLDDVLAYENVVKAGSAEKIRIRIPAGTQKIKLMLGDGGDGIFSDVSDFANAKLCNELFPDNGTYSPDFTKDYVYLSDMNYLDYNAFVGANGAYIKRDTNIRGGDLYTLYNSYEKGLCLHAATAGAAKAFVEFDIKGLDYTVFAAYLGLAESNLTSDNLSAASVKFIVYADDVIVYESSEMKKADEDLLVSVDITGASRLRLEIDPGASNASDWGTFGNAVIGRYDSAEEVYAAIEAEKPTYEYLSDMEFSSYHAFVGSAGEYIMRDTNIRGGDLYTLYHSYDKGLCMHAEGAGAAKAYVEFDIKGLGYTVFATYLGLAESKLASDNLSAASVNFLVYVDNVKVYESGEMTKADEDKLISIDITGASKLKLVVDPGTSNASDWGTFGNAVIGKYSTAEELYAVIEAEQTEGNPTQAPTQDPTETPTKAPTHAPTETPTKEPTHVPTETPTQAPTQAPTETPTQAPTQAPTETPTQAPTHAPTETPTQAPTQAPDEELLPDNGTYTPDFTKDFVYLSDMNYSDYHAFVGANGAYIMRDTNIRGAELYTLYNSFDKGLCLHAASAGTARAFVEFDVKDLGYTVLAAYLGLAESKTDILTDASVNFIIYADDVVVYESGEMKKSDEDLLISVDITGASKIRLEIDPGASNSSDWGTFGNAVIGKYSSAEEVYAAIEAEQSSGEPTEAPTEAPEDDELLPDNGTYSPDFAKDYVYLSDMNYSDYHCFVGSRGAYIMRDINIYQEDLFTLYNSYDKGLCIHTDVSTPAFVEFDIKDLGYTVFAAHLGIADSKSADTGMASLGFTVYVDDVKAYESGKMVKDDEEQLISVDITGASRLRIEVDALGNNSGDWAVIGNAVIGRYSTAEEVYAAIEADVPDPVNPVTGDGSVVFMGVAFTAALAVLSVFNIRKKKLQ